MDEKALLKKIEELESELANIKESPRYSSYKSALKQLKFWDSEIDNDPISIKIGSEDNKRAFDNVLNYLMQRQKLFDSLEIDKNFLLPIDISKAEKEATSEVDDIRRSIKNELRNGAKADN